jgi:hypothetical protein
VKALSIYRGISMKQRRQRKWELLNFNVFAYGGTLPTAPLQLSPAQLLNISSTSMDITHSVAMALVHLSPSPRPDKPDVALTLPSPDHSDYDLTLETMEMKVPGKRLPHYSTSPDDQPTQTEEAMQLKIGT